MKCIIRSKNFVFCLFTRGLSPTIYLTCDIIIRSFYDSTSYFQYQNRYNFNIHFKIQRNFVTSNQPQFITKKANNTRLTLCNIQYNSYLVTLSVVFYYFDMTNFLFWLPNFSFLCFRSKFWACSYLKLSFEVQFKTSFDVG